MEKYYLIEFGLLITFAIWRADNIYRHSIKEKKIVLKLIVVVSLLLLDILKFVMFNYSLLLFAGVISSYKETIEFYKSAINMINNGEMISGPMFLNSLQVTFLISILILLFCKLPDYFVTIIDWAANYPIPKKEKKVLGNG